MVKSDLEYCGLKQFIFPGWGMPLEIYDPYLNLSRSSEILDFNFFRENGIPLDFSGWNFETDEDCFIVGHSLGGLLALKAASEISRIKALVLFAPFARFTEDSGYAAQAVEKMRLQLDKNPIGLLKSFHRRMGFNCDIPEKLNIDALRAGLDALLELDFRGIVQEIDVPALVICAGNDLIVSRDMVDFVTDSLKRSSCVLLEDSGHAVPFSHQKQCMELIVEFLKDAI